MTNGGDEASGASAFGMPITAVDAASLFEEKLIEMIDAEIFLKRRLSPFAIAVMQSGLFLLTIPCLGHVAVANASTQGTAAWVHGSFVNLRQIARADAAVVEQWPLNTPVQLLGRNGDWCEVEGPNSKRGFITCRLIGNKLLTMGDMKTMPAGDAMRRGFWIAPSWGRLADIGHALTNSLLSEKQRAADFNTQRATRWPVPEFDAAKARLIGGVKPKADDEIDNVSRPIPPAVSDSFPKGALPQIAPSLFRKRTEFVLTPTLDQAAALSGSTLQLKRIIRGPQYHSDRFDDQWFDGTWDIGEAELSITPPVVEYGLAANGLLSAKGIDSAVVSPGPAGAGCGSVNVSDRYDSWRPRLEKNLPGYPRIKQEQEVTRFFTSHTLRPDFVQVIAREFRASMIDSNGQRSVGKVVVYLIDLNKDNVPDIAIIKGQVPGSISPFLATIRVLVNIAGDWSLELDMVDDDCT